MTTARRSAGLLFSSCGRRRSRGTRMPAAPKTTATARQPRRHLCAPRRRATGTDRARSRRWSDLHGLIHHITLPLHRRLWLLQTYVWVNISPPARQRRGRPAAVALPSHRRWTPPRRTRHSCARRPPTRAWLHTFRSDHTMCLPTPYRTTTLLLRRREVPLIRM